MNDEVNKLVPQHLLGVKVSDKEADVVALDLLPPQDDEVLGAAHHEPHELVAEQLLHVVRLLDCYRDPHGVNARLNKNLKNVKLKMKLEMSQIFTLSFSFLDITTGLRSSSGDSWI